MNNNILDLITTGEIDRLDSAIDTEELFNFDNTAYDSELNDVLDSEREAMKDNRKESRKMPNRQPKPRQ